MDKIQIRKKMRDQLHHIPDSTRTQWNEGLLKNAQEFLLAHSQGFWGAYMALKEEPSVECLWKLFPQIAWCFPKVESDFTMKYLRVTDPGHWIEGPFKGLLEPDPHFHAEVPIGQLIGCFVPALAFDSKGYRLGRGRGYYDRALENYNGIKVGIAYSIQILKTPFPKEPHDVCMDYLLTENELIQIHRKD